LHATGCDSRDKERSSFRRIPCGFGLAEWCAIFFPHAMYVFGCLWMIRETGMVVVFVWRNEKFRSVDGQLGASYDGKRKSDIVSNV